MQKEIKAISFIVLKIEEYIVIITGILACVFIVVSAFMRYVMSKDFYGSEELILMAAFWLYFIGSALATREDSHISADMLSSALKSQRSKDILQTVRHTLSLIISLLATVWSYNYVMWSVNLAPTTPILKWPMTWMQVPILISFILSDFYILAHLIRDIKTLAGKKEEQA